MNKKGFTLVELLAVIVILSILALIAIPNMVGLTDDVKKDGMLDDAKKLISLAKYQVNVNYEVRILNEYTFYFNDLNVNGDIKADQDGGIYSNSSYVKYYKNNGNTYYCIYLDGSKRRIGTSSSCVNDSELFSRNVVITK